ncbi:MAG: hypothetical protein IJZ45_11475 [Bacteroidaceae bacterium]|nr:hypothetical protein [Bacteroidaceae bacterium]
MKRLDYEAPTMEEIVVEMENGFLGGSADIQNPNNNNGRINPHEVNTDFTDSADFSEDGWD